MTSCEPPGPPPRPGTAGPFPSSVGCLALHSVTLRVGRTCASTSLCSGTLLRSTRGRPSRSLWVLELMVKTQVLGTGRWTQPCRSNPLSLEDCGVGKLFFPPSHLCHAQMWLQRFLLPLPAAVSHRQPSESGSGVKPPPAPLGQLWGGCPRLLLAPQSCCGAEAGTSLLLEVSRPQSRTISHHPSIFPAVHSCLLPTKYQVGHFKLMQASFALDCERSIKPTLSFCFIPISPSVSLQMLATYLLINCTANGRPLSSPAPESEALWERCLPIVSLSTRGFFKTEMFQQAEGKLPEIKYLEA